MATNYRVLLVLSLLVTLVAAQSSTRRKSSSSAATRPKTTSTSSLSTAEQSRTLGIFGPLLRLGLGGLRRTGTSASTQSDPFYGGGGGYYPGANSVYGNYGNGVGYGGGYRPPTAYPSYNNGGYQQQSFNNLGGGLNSLSSFANTGNSQGGYASNTAGVGGIGGGQGSNVAQQAQVAALLGQVLGSSLRPLLMNAGRFGTAGAVAPAAVRPATNPFVGLLGLFG